MKCERPQIKETMLSESQMKRIEPLFLLAQGVPRMEERDRLCDSQRPSVERRFEIVWSAQGFI